MDYIDPKELEQFTNKFREIFKRDPFLLIWTVPKNALDVAKSPNNNDKLRQLISDAEYLINLPLDDYDFMSNQLHMVQCAETSMITALFIDADTYSMKKTIRPIGIGKVNKAFADDRDQPYKFKTKSQMVLFGLRCLCRLGNYEPIDILREMYRCFYIEILINRDISEKSKVAGIGISVDTLKKQYPVIDYVPEELRNNEYTRVSSLCMYVDIHDQIKDISRLSKDNDPPIDVGILRMCTADIPHLLPQLIPLVESFDIEFQYEYFTTADIKIEKKKDKKWFEKRYRDIESSLYAQCMNMWMHNLLVVDKENDNRIIGVVRYMDNYEEPVFLQTLYLYPEYRGKGLGSWLLQQLYMETYNNGHSRPQVRLLAYNYNPRVIHFYEKNGFIVNRINFYTSFTPLNSFTVIDPLSL